MAHLPSPSHEARQTESSPLLLQTEQPRLGSTQNYDPSSGNGHEEPVPPHPKSPIIRWEPFFASHLVVRLVCGSNVCLAIVLAGLWLISHLRHGILPIDLSNPNVLTPWHFVPTAIATIDALIFGAIGSTLLFCQPYMLLQRQGGVNAKESLTLDYNSRSMPIVAVEAIRRRHWVPFIIAIAVLYVSCL